MSSEYSTGPSNFGGLKSTSFQFRDNLCQAFPILLQPIHSHQTQDSDFYYIFGHKTAKKWFGNSVGLVSEYIIASCKKTCKEQKSICTFNSLIRSVAHKNEWQMLKKWEKGLYSYWTKEVWSSPLRASGGGRRRALTQEMKKEILMLNHKGFLNPQIHKYSYSGGWLWAGHHPDGEFMSGLDCYLWWIGAVRWSRVFYCGANICCEKFLLSLFNPRELADTANWLHPSIWY